MSIAVVSPTLRNTYVEDTVLRSVRIGDDQVLSAMVFDAVGEGAVNTTTVRDTIETTWKHTVGGSEPCLVLAFGAVSYETFTSSRWPARRMYIGDTQMSYSEGKVDYNSDGDARGRVDLWYANNIEPGEYTMKHSAADDQKDRFEYAEVVANSVSYRNKSASSWGANEGDGSPETVSRDVAAAGFGAGLFGSVDPDLGGFTDLDGHEVFNLSGEIANLAYSHIGPVDAGQSMKFTADRSGGSGNWGSWMFYMGP